MTGSAATRRLNVLAYPRYGRSAPSSRYRILQFLPFLAEQGVDVEISPLLGDWYMAGLVAGRHPSAPRVTGAYLGRIARQLRRPRPDLIWLEKELLPWLPWPLERALLRGGVPVMLDLDDSQFHRYDQHGSGLVRRLLGGKIDRGMAAADLVTCGSPYIAERATQAGARQVVGLPTAIDLARYPLQPRERATDPGCFTIGWIGTPSNTDYLAALEAPLRRLAGEVSLRILVIGGRPGILPGLPVEHRTWNEASETQDLQDMDVGIMPLPDRPWERGKCGLKLLQYMASWKPTIASPVGVNETLVEAGVSGFLARDADEWYAALRLLHAEPARRRAMGAAGRRRVEARYSAAILAPRLAELMRQTAG